MALIFSFNQKVAQLIRKKILGNFASGCGKNIYLYTFSGCNYIKSWGPVSFCGWSDPLRHSRTHYESIFGNTTAAKFRKQFIRACLSLNEKVAGPFSHIPFRCCWIYRSVWKMARTGEQHFCFSHLWSPWDALWVPEILCARTKQRSGKEEIEI